MARVGINPARGVLSDYHPAPISVAMITYIPDQSGYFADRLKILSLSLSSLLKHTPQPYDLIIFDNGSCAEVVNYLRDLQDAGRIQYLILSNTNIGKIGALQILFNAAPGEIIAYSDDDIFFNPGWLEPQLEILAAFPKAGLVSGVPVRNAALHARRSLDQLIDHPEPGITIRHDRSIPDEWEADWALSTGRNPRTHLAETQNWQDMVLKTNSAWEAGCIEAIGSANHFQFVARKEILLQALPTEWTGKLMGHMLELDQAVDELGYLRLSTTRRYTRHLGNTLSPGMVAEAEQLGVTSSFLDNPSAQTDGIAVTEKSRKHWAVRIPGMRRVLMWTYKRLFDILYR
jgi:Glycosyl transferase family 2